MTRITCPHCNQPYDLSPDQVPAYSGQTITCTQCNKPFTVANLTGSNPQAPSSATEGAVPPIAQPASVAYGGYAHTVQRTSGLAITALVCGVLALVLPPLGIVAIILGIIALGKTRDPAVGGRGMAIAGISVGAAAMVVSACLLSILLPSLNRARETANRVKCASNMRQIGQAILLYQNENNGFSPPDLKTAIITQDIGTAVACCPSSNVVAAATPQAFNPQVNSSFIYLGAGTQMRTIDPEMILLYEPVTNHDGDGANFLFGDGHVEFIGKTQAPALIAQLESGQNPPK